MVSQTFKGAICGKWRALVNREKCHWKELCDVRLMDQKWKLWTNIESEYKGYSQTLHDGSYRHFQLELFPVFVWKSIMFHRTCYGVLSLYLPEQWREETPICVRLHEGFCTIHVVFYINIWRCGDVHVKGGGGAIGPKKMTSKIIILTSVCLFFLHVRVHLE